MRDVIRNLREYPPTWTDWVFLVLGLACLGIYWAEW